VALEVSLQKSVGGEINRKDDRHKGVQPTSNHRVAVPTLWLLVGHPSMRLGIFPWLVQRCMVRAKSSTAWGPATSRPCWNFVGSTLR
jgi:hypothetical protein